mgnify:CR=1 FL=1
MNVRYLKSKHTKFDALNLTKNLLQGVEDIERKPPFEPKSKIPFSEASAQSAILDYLLLEMVVGHLFVQRVNNAPIYDSETGKYRSLSKGQNAGFPDLFCLKGGKAIFFEVKSSIGDQKKPDQVKMQHELEKHGGYYFIVRSVDGVKRALQTLNT